MGAGLGSTSSPLAPPTGTVRSARVQVSCIYRVFPIGNARDSRPGPDGSRARQDKGFMSTQRRENRWQRRSCTERDGAFRPLGPTPAAQYACAHAMVGTAPPATQAWLATNSLQSDYRTTQLVRFVKLAPSGNLHSSPPPGAAFHANLGKSAFLRSSLSYTPFPSEFARLSPALP